MNRARLREAGVAPPRTVADLRAVAQAFRRKRGAPKITPSLAEGAPTAITVSELVLGFSDAMNEAVRRILQGGRCAPVLDRLHAGVAEAARRRNAPYPPPR